MVETSSPRGRRAKEVDSKSGSKVDARVLKLVKRERKVGPSSTSYWNEFGASGQKGRVDSRQDGVVGEGVRERGTELDNEFQAGDVVAWDNEGDRLFLVGYLAGGFGP